VQRCLGSAADLREAVNAATWDIISTAADLPDSRRAASEALRSYVAEALDADEHVTALRPALQEATRRASRLLRESVQPTSQPQPPTPQPIPAPAPPPPGEEVIEESQTVSLSASDAAPVLEKLRRRLMETPGARLTLAWRLTRPKGEADV
jgi:hypothetical protein